MKTERDAHWLLVRHHLHLVDNPETLPSYRIGVPHCSGPCAQGRSPCPCPDECALPEADIQPSGRVALVLAVLVVALLAALVFGQ